MANPSLSRITVQRDCSAPATAITLARLAATKAVKRQMAAQGMKVPTSSTGSSPQRPTFIYTITSPS